jgi:hypothetical protein
LSPVHYPTTHTAHSNNHSFTFTTDSGQVYEVYFDMSNGMFPDPEIDQNAMYIGFSCKPPQEKFDRNHDPRIGITIMYILANMFNTYKRAIFSFVCSPADGQARNRYITFARWYSQSPIKEKIELLRKQIGGTYCGILFSKKHPDLDKIEFNFNNQFDPDNKFDPITQVNEEENEDFNFY